MDAILARPGRVAGGTALLAGLAVALGAGVELRTSRQELAPPGDPEQARLDRVMAEIGGGDALIACVEAAPGQAVEAARLRAAADDLAAAFAASPLVDQVFYRVEMEWLADHLPSLAPPDLLTQVVAAARQEADLLALLPEVRSLADLNAALARRLAAARRAGAARPTPQEEAQAAATLAGLAALLRFEARLLADPSQAAGLDLAAALLPEGGGYLSTRDGSLLFLLVRPAATDDSLPFLRRLVKEMRARAAEVSSRHPGVAVAFTGTPATTVEEMEIIRRDTWRTAAVAAAGVVLLTLLVFRWRSHALLVLAALAAGLAWSLGAVRLELGYLNLITSSFLSTLVGVGVAYGIHPVAEYELQGAHTGDPLAAIRAAYHATGAAVTVSGITTAVAFLSILLMDFRGFAELGLVAGVGVLLCLLAMLVSLPALLALAGGWRRRPRSGAAPARRAAVDRIWAARGALLAGRWPRTVSLAALILTAGLGWLAKDLAFNINFLDLLPAEAESLRYQRRMILESDLTPANSVVVADDLPALRAAVARAGQEPSIARVESVLRFLPADPEATAAAQAGLAELLAPIRLPARTRALDPAEMTASLSALEAALAGASEEAFGAGLGALAGALEEARAAAAAAMEAAATASPEARAGWNTAQERLLASARQGLERLRRGAAAAPPTPADLPADLAGRFVTRQGRHVAFLHPAGDIFDPEFLDAYVAAARRVDPEATGFPVVFARMAGRITGGFRQAVAAGVVLVALILLVDTRSLRDTLLALLPLGMGVVWMLGAMRLLGLSYNFANLVAVPLIIGVGIDSGVHVIHRFRLEGSQGMTVVMEHTARAVLIASLTTMVGFGSLALASHRGLASLGLVLLLGVGACLITATVVLPCIMLSLGLARR